MVLLLCVFSRSKLWSIFGSFLFVFVVLR